jgi:hypothetical protein
VRESVGEQLAQLARELLSDRDLLLIEECKSRSRTVAEYALRDLAKPVGVARYVTKLVESLPADLRGTLPSVRQLEGEMRKARGEGWAMGSELFFEEIPIGWETTTLGFGH